MYKIIAPPHREGPAKLPRSAAVAERGTRLGIVPSARTLNAQPVTTMQVLGSTPLPNQDHHIQLGYFTEHHPELAGC